MLTFEKEPFQGTATIVEKLTVSDVCTDMRQEF
jgi:hypothetical protein